MNVPTLVITSWNGYAVAGLRRGGRPPGVRAGRRAPPGHPAGTHQTDPGPRTGAGWGAVHARPARRRTDLVRGHAPAPGAGTRHRGVRVHPTGPTARARRGGSPDRRVWTVHNRYSASGGGRFPATEARGGGQPGGPAVAGPGRPD